MVEEFDRKKLVYYWYAYLPFDEAIPLLGIQESEPVNALPLLHHMHCCSKDGLSTTGLAMGALVSVY